MGGIESDAATSSSEAMTGDEERMNQNMPSPTPHSEGTAAATGLSTTTACSLLPPHNPSQTPPPHAVTSDACGRDAATPSMSGAVHGQDADRQSV
jgi:hypothetical protein